MAIPPPPEVARIAVRVSHEAVRHWDVPDGGLAWYGNPAAAFGEAAGDPPCTFDGFLERVHPDEREALREELSAWLASSRSEWTGRYRLRGRDGFWIEVFDRSFARRDDDGGATVVSTLADLDAEARRGSPWSAADGSDGEHPGASAGERQMDRLYRALAENASDIITVMAPDGEIRYESPSLERILGFDPEELVGRNAFEFIHPDDRERVQRSWAAGGGDPGQVGAVEYRCRHADGSWRYLESTGRRSPEGGELEGILVHSRDVTDRIELERRLEQSRKMETVGRLVGGIAHDFNNLMTVISGNSEFLLDGLREAEPEHTAATEIRDAARRAGRLTRHLLAFGRQENLNLQAIDIAAGIRGLRPRIEEVLGDRIALELRLPEERAVIRVDLELAQQVMLEVVSNARDAMPEGGVLRIEVRKERVGRDSPLVSRGIQPGDWIVTTYADTGTGMSRQVEERAFEPYFSTRKGRPGLGLSMVYGLVKQSRGEVWIDSAPGEGTTVHTYMPDVESEESG